MHDKILMYTVLK